MTDLTTPEIVSLIVITFAAGLVRGFSGFALSALVMAVAVIFLPPIEILPMLWFLEMGASLMMVRGGLRDADMKIATPLIFGTWIGWPIGLALTVSIDAGTSKLAALSVILVLAAMSLSKLRVPGLEGRIAGGLTGVVAGIVSGIAHVGGMVIALYVLSLGSAARNTRGTLVLYLFASAIFSFFVQLGFGVMDMTGATRGAMFLAPTLLGVWLGTKLFTPRWEGYYRPFCLTLLILLAGIGLLREVWA